MEIEVLYSDLHRERKPIGNAHELTKTGVLAIIFSCQDDENPRVEIDGVGYRRRDQFFGKDFYFLLHYVDQEQDWYAVDACDESDFATFYKTYKPWNDAKTRTEFPRYNCWTLTFEGARVDDATWARAMEKFEGMH